LGAVLAYRQANAATDVQPGVQAALGYRRPLSTTLRGRIELHWQAVRRSDAFTPKTVYSVLAGFSAPVRGTGPPAPTGAGWRPTIGFQGGYANYHMTGLGGFTFLAAPGLGGAMYLGTPFPIVLPPTIFVTVPLGGRVAAEIGLDVNRLQRSDSSQLAVNTLIRLDYAFDRHWYAAAGVALHTLTQTGASSATVAGLAAAAGYRFSLVGALGGRVEMSYTAMQRNVRFAVASETLAILVGMTLPLR
jgi:hypothetical protein